VSAKDKATSKEQKVTITHSSGLAKDEVEKMVKNAREHEAEDKARREVVELKNKGENLVYQLEKLVKENKDKLTPESVTAVEEGVKEVQKAREGEDKAALEAAIQKLEQASHKAAEEMYRAAAAQGGPQGPAAGAPDAGAGGPGSQATPNNPEPGKKDDVVDAEFRTN